MTAPVSVPIVAGSELDPFLEDFHEARRREQQWRTAQILTTLLAPIATLISIVFIVAGRNLEAMASGGLALVAGLAAALLAVQVWRWHRKAVGIFNHISRDARDARRLLMEAADTH